MSDRSSPARRVAYRLAKHASGVMPRERSAWAEAMLSDMAHIESDGEALNWALGCLMASYSERIRSVEIMRGRAVRWLLTVAILLLAVREVFATALTLAYRLNDLKLANALGRLTPGDDYRRFVPLLNATPLLHHGLWLVGTGLFVVSAILLSRGKPIAAPLFASACGLDLVVWLVQRTSPTYVAAFHFNASNAMRDHVAPTAQLILMMGLGLAIWAASRSKTGTSPQI